MNNYIAIGDVIMDVYLDASWNPLGYYAGGSVWNDLINIKNHSRDACCYGIGTCGSDPAGDWVLDIFSRHGIDMSSIRRTRHPVKRFSIIVDGEKTKSQKTCPVCGQSVWQSGTAFPAAIPAQFEELEPGVVLIDSLKKNTLELAKKFRDKGWLTAGDIGYTNHLRYLSIEGIRDLIVDRFDILQLNERVYRFLANKLSLDGEKQLFEVLGCRYLSVTKGAEGSEFVYRDPSGNTASIYAPAKSADVVDPTGAGDMYFSTLLYSLDRRGDLEGDVSGVVDLAARNAGQRIGTVGGVGVLEQIDVLCGDCSVCGSVNAAAKAKRSKRQQIETNTTHLLNRILRSMESDASQRVKAILDGIDGTIYMVGTGGSYASALYAAETVNEYHPTSKAVACHPRDILISGLNKVTAVFLFSYSGSTKDIMNVYALCEERGVPVCLVTKKQSTGFPELPSDSIISYSNSNSSTKERGFLSIAGTLIPMCVFAEAYYHEVDCAFRDFLKKCFSDRSEEFSRGIGYPILSAKGLTIDIFSESGTSCAALDLESKFVESGLGRVVVHEKKDFSHGRFNILERIPPDFIVFLEARQGRYSKKLKEYLMRREIPMILLSTQYPGILGQLDLMIASQFFLKAVSKQANYDMSRPDYPQDAMTLYRYAGKDLL